MAEMVKRPVEPITDLAEGFKMTELGPLPEEWEVVRLREIAEYMKAGGTPSRKEPKYWGGGIPFVLIEDMTSCGLYLRSTKETVSQEGLENSSAWLVPPGSLLLSMYATIGETAINTIPVTTNQAILAIIPKPTFCAEFGAYLLKFCTSKLVQHNVQSTQKNVNKGIVERFPIPLPPLPEQRAIAYVLHAVQQAKEATERVIQATRELKNSLMRHLFTYGPVPVSEAERVPLKETEIGRVPKRWEVVRLGEVMELVYRYPSYYGIEYVDHGVAEVRGELLKENGEIEDNPGLLRYVTEETAANFPKTRLAEGDVVISVRGTMGKIGIVRRSLVGAVITANLMRLSPDRNRIYSDYLKNLLMSDMFRSMLNTLSPQTTIKTIQAPVLKSIPIPVPSLNEQRQIAHILEAVDKKLQAEEVRKQALDALFKTLLYHLMTGKVRVRDVALSETGEVV